MKKAFCGAQAQSSATEQSGTSEHVGSDGEGR